MQTFRDLKVWQKAHALTLEIYRATKKFPSDEKFGIIAQLRRSFSSIPTNIVEGFKRRSKKEQGYFFNVAESSLEETKYHLILSRDLGYLSHAMFGPFQDQADEVGRMLNAYRQAVLRRPGIS